MRQTPRYFHQSEQNNCMITYHPLGYERVYLPLGKAADTPFHIQRGDILKRKNIRDLLQ